MMFEKPIPLREALTEAIEELLTLHHDLYFRDVGEPGYQAMKRAEERIALLISQIPLVFEARGLERDE